VSFKLIGRRLPFALPAVLTALLAAMILIAPVEAQAGSDTAIPSSGLLEPKELVQMLASTQEMPLILQVGVRVLYVQAHIPGAEYVGAAGTDAGLEALRKRVSRASKTQFIVLYCGCCPWDDCPNIRPAYNQLQALGFTHVKVLHLAENFGTDWVKKGYPADIQSPLDRAHDGNRAQ
jgi:hypothetical protein